MKVFAITLAVTLALTLPQTANAQSFLDKIDKMVSDVESTVSKTENTINRATGTAERLNNVVPETGTGEDEKVAPATTQPQTTLSAEEQEILDRAAKIEERRILEEAEKIKQRQAASSSSSTPVSGATSNNVADQIRAQRRSRQ